LPCVINAFQIFDHTWSASSAASKDQFGARAIRVRGAKKIMAHLMFGVLALTVDQLLKLTG
jgi:hypothetical protein